MICSWADLRSVRVIHSLLPAAYTHLASLPNLQKITFAEKPLWREPLKTFPLPTTPATAFPALRQLKADVKELSLCTTMFRGMHCSPLKCIEISLEGYAKPAVWFELFDAMAKHCDTSSLEQLSAWEIYRRFDEVYKTKEWVIDFETIRPLLVFSNITHASLPFGDFDLDDAAIKEVAKAWPRVRFLKLCNGSCPPKPHLTLLALSYFAEHCPDLEHLHMFIDATVIPTTTPTSSRRKRIPLRLLLDKSPVSHPREVAGFITKCFPNISWIHGPSLSMPILPSGWDEVREFLTLKKARFCYPIYWPGTSVEIYP